MVHGLFGRQLRDRRHYAEGIRGQHDNRLRVRRKAGCRSVRDEMQRIGATGVFGQRSVIEIRNAVFVHHHVFEHGAKAAGRSVDLGFGLGREADRLRVAAAFEVEDAVFAPAMLVVADQRAIRIGRQRGLAGARQAEKTAASPSGPTLAEQCIGMTPFSGRR